MVGTRSQAKGNTKNKENVNVPLNKVITSRSEPPPTATSASLGTDNLKSTRAEVTSEPVAAPACTAAAPVMTSQRRHMEPIPTWASLVATPFVAATERPLEYQDNPSFPLPTPHAQYLGTLHKSCNKNNKNTQDTHNNDFRYLADAITSLAGPSRSQQRRVSDLKLSLFDGRTLDWLPFKRTYDFTKGAFSPLENLARLSGAVRGAAREAVCSLLASTEEPEDVMRALEARFARPEHVILQELALVKALPKLSSIEGGKELCQFSCRVRRCLDTIRALNQHEYLASPELCNIIIGKFSSLLRARWADYASIQVSHQTKFRLEILSDFLVRETELHTKFGFIPDNVAQRNSVVISNRAPNVYSACTQDWSETSSEEDGCYLAASHDRSRVRDANRAPSKDQRQLAPSCDKQPNQQAVASCKLCKKAIHDIECCEQFQLMSLEDRWQWVLDTKVCRKCLKKGSHTYRDCKARCTVANCKNSHRHHTLLHITQTETTNHVGTLPNNTDTTNTTTNLETVAHNSSSHQTLNRPLLKVIPVILSGPKGEVQSYALLDDGSTVTMVDQNISEQIGATGPKGHMRVNCIGGLSKDSEVSHVTLNIRGLHTSETYTIANVRAVPNLGISSQTVLPKDIAISHLADLTEHLCFEQAKPMLIIGTDNWHLTIAHEVRKGTNSQPVAIRTLLGWVVYGFSSSRTSLVDFVNHTTVYSDNLSEHESLETLIKEYHRLDSIGIIVKDYHTSSEQRALKLLEETTSRLPSGRFVTGLLWREDIKDVPDSYDLALSRFMSLERKFKKDKAYEMSYRQNIQAMIDKGYAEICKNTLNSTGILWYLPHFGVVHPQKKKLRVVHDAAAKTKGVSFNSMLLPGPDFLQNLVAILMRFREGCVALNGDIKDMFPQIKIRKEDCDAQRFLWRDSSSIIQTYRMTSMIFGATCSPCVALYLKNKNALEARDLFPAAAHAIVNNHYMDDYLGSHDDVTKAAQIAADIVHVHSLAGFEMRSWVSNKVEALSLLPSNLRSDNVSGVNLGSESISNHVRILGLLWDTVKDQLCFRTGFLDEPFTSLSKRKVLSDLMRVYDPLGLLTPIVIQGRIIFQELWRSKLSWDETLPPELAVKWLSWVETISKISLGSIPRWYQTCHTGKPQVRELHVFADASECAYACVAYWRFTFENDDVELALIGGKARLTPLKPVTIPRLELQAALLAARFAKFIIDSHTHKPHKTYFWSDSMTVIRWLRSDARVFKTFVAHRVGEITEITDLGSWRYIPTLLNAADVATRPSIAPIDSSSQWFAGPSFLLDSPLSWPCEPTVNSSLPLDELKVKTLSTLQESVGHLTVTPIVADHSKFSEWLRLVRTTARVQQFVEIIRHSLKNKTKNSKVKHTILPLTAELIIKAEKRLFLRSQLDSFPGEMARVRNSEALSKSSRLRNLAMIFGDDGLLKLSGRTSRIQDNTLSHEPNVVILDGKHPIVRLLIAYHHKKAAHANNELVVNQLRREYYIIGLRLSVRSVTKSCLFCRIRKVKPSIPPIGDLPEARLAHHTRPFTHTGLDYFGPVTVTIGRRTEKRYVAIFTCLTIRAIHIEIVGSLSTDSAIMALRRFISRRGCPTHIYSDNGTAFVGANNQLPAIQDYAANNKIEWKFIPPSAPFMGGCWERMVRSVKAALSVTLKERSPREEVLHTFLLEAEAIINSRPLTHVAVAEGEDQSLTPYHFLLLKGPSQETPAKELTDDDFVRRTDWKKGLRLADYFWKRWVVEYLPDLMPRHGSTPNKRQVAVDDMVFIVDGSLPRGTWPRGRVIKVYPGKDGIVRVADVATQGGVLKRPCKKLAVIPTGSI